MFLHSSRYLKSNVHKRFSLANQNVTDYTVVMLEYLKYSLVLLTILTASCAENNKNVQKVAEAEGLVAFWDFNHRDETAWQSYYDDSIINRPFPVYLRQIADPIRYNEQNWPYQGDEAGLQFDHSGPFGNAVRFNQGYIYGEIPRDEFDDTLLDLKGRKPFTMIAWVKFDGNRHMVAGIWDEGGWNRYAGRRQAALFAGLFNQDGVIAHVSSTGAASFPQSDIDGAQYARLRAIDGAPFENGQWVSIAMTFDPENNQVIAYLDGIATEYTIPDPVTEDVLEHEIIPPANPFTHALPLYSPMSFQIKYNGYDYKNGNIKEHLLWVNLENDTLDYSQVGAPADQQFRIEFDIIREGKSILRTPITTDSVEKIEFADALSLGDMIQTSLYVKAGEDWQQVGTTILKEIMVGAPFTFGRALGLDEDGLEHGSVNIVLDGVAIFNRVLNADELMELSFKN